MKIVFYIVLTLVLFSLPLFLALWHYRTKKSSILRINQDYIKNPRYFGESFAGMLESKMDYWADGTHIRLSREEEYLDDQEAKECHEREISSMVICREDYQANPENAVFEKEVYCGRDASFLMEGTVFRAVYAKRRLLLGKRTDIIRWADAGESAVVYDNSDLGISFTAGREVVLGKGCSFQRVYAPVIHAGQHPDELRDEMESRDKRIYAMPIIETRENNVRYINQEMVNEEGVIEATVLSWRNVTLVEKAILCGNIRSHKGVRVCDNAAVIGNIFAEDDVHIERNATVLGNVFCQGTVTLEEGAVVGQRGRISSVIAREHIRLKGGNTIFGMISCEHGGSIDKDPESEERVTLQFLEGSKEREEISFSSLEEYQGIDEQGFRKDHALKKASIPGGALWIPDSQFFACDHLLKISLPGSLQRIGDFAFSDCVSLRELTDFRELSLSDIGVSAFENCRELSAIHLPRTLTTLRNAAFAGCEGLKEVSFEEGAALLSIGDHCFRDCRSLTEVVLPESLEKVGLSAFTGCSSLRRVTCAPSLKEEPGIRELLSEHPGLELIFLPSQEGGKE